MGGFHQESNQSIILLITQFPVIGIAKCTAYVVPYRKSPRRSRHISEQSGFVTRRKDSCSPGARLVFGEPSPWPVSQGEGRKQGPHQTQPCLPVQPVFPGGLDTRPRGLLPRAMRNGAPAFAGAWTAARPWYTGSRGISAGACAPHRDTGNGRPPRVQACLKAGAHATPVRHTGQSPAGLHVVMAHVTPVRDTGE